MIIYGGLTKETAMVGTQIKIIEQYGSHIESMELTEVSHENIGAIEPGCRGRSLTHPKHMGTRIFSFNDSYVVLRKANGKISKPRHPDANLSLPLRKYIIKNDDVEITFVPRNDNNPKSIHPINEEEILSLVLSNKNF